MAVGSLLNNARITPVKSGAERRRHKRIPMTLLGRFMREDKTEFPCRMLDMSVGGVAFTCPTDLAPGEKVIAYFDHIGGIEGRVTRRFPGGFAIELVVSQHKKQKLANQLDWLGDPEKQQAEPPRRHDRTMIDKKHATAKVDGDIEFAVEIMNISLSGASIASSARPPIGSMMTLGKLNAKVVRHHPDGFAVEFIGSSENARSGG